MMFSHFRRMMIHVSSENAQRYDRVKRKGVAFLSNLFKSRKLTVGMKINEDEEMERAPKVETPGKFSETLKRSSILTLNGSQNGNRGILYQVQRNVFIPQIALRREED